MAVLEENSTDLAATSDYFQALEQRVLRTIETLKEEREHRASLEARAGQLEEELTELKKERDEVRQRVERLLKQLDEA